MLFCQTRPDDLLPFNEGKVAVKGYKICRVFGDVVLVELRPPTATAGRLIGCMFHERLFCDFPAKFVGQFPADAFNGFYFYLAEAGGILLFLVEGRLPPCQFFTDPFPELVLQVFEILRYRFQFVCLSVHSDSD